MQYRIIPWRLRKNDKNNRYNLILLIIQKGTYAVIIGHSDDGLRTRVRLPSGARKTLSSDCRATVGIVAGGGRTEKPILKAGN